MKVEWIVTGECYKKVPYAVKNVIELIMFVATIVNFYFIFVFGRSFTVINIGKFE